MENASYLWNGFSVALDYGFQKIGQGAAWLSNTTFDTTRKVSQIGSHRFAPQLYSMTVWIEDNPQLLNLAVNHAMMAAGIAHLHNIRYASAKILVQNK